ncbi:hypothetical protein [Arthrobacter sp. YN]|uniref:hypothetical protein n=1 Tax=Arthrobacter sp. YN TaxID=2020486 RepID=UPI000B5F640E|nr:hypothetical protein [Arthrobacter sp. YN]ASN20651.1 hypothetical protein CGK93_13925 [Arthrobacter sp. YN]
MNTLEGPQRAVVRLFPDYGDTALWLDGPIDYSLTGLTEGLVHELRDWEQSYYESLTRGFTWKSAESAARYTAQGHRLAQRVADELGDGYEIDFTSYEDNARPHRFFGTKAPNPQAVAAFDALTSTSRAEKERVARALADAPPGTGTGWFATAPLSGSVFRPTQKKQE